MSRHFTPDRLEIINGPEDGVSYPIAQPMFHVGADGACAIPLSLDPRVAPRAALLSAVAEGYRVRWLDGPSVWVNNRRAGAIRSRVLRHGEVLRVGDTELTLLLAPDGLASRSGGLPVTSDLAWALRMFGAFLADGFRGLFRLVFGRRHRWLRLGLTALVLYVFLRLAFPEVLDWIEYYLRYAANYAYGFTRYHLTRLYYQVMR